MREGSAIFEKRHPLLQERDMLYDGAVGTNYGISAEETEDEFGCPSFSGRTDINEQYFALAAHFNILPKKNRYFETLHPAELGEKLDRIVSSSLPPEYMILTEAEERSLFQILAEESFVMAELYQQLFECACRLMHSHAPNVSGQIDRIVFQTLFFQTVGLIGGCAVKPGTLALPDFDGLAAVYIRTN